MCSWRETKGVGRLLVRTSSSGFFTEGPAFEAWRRVQPDAACDRLYYFPAQGGAFRVLVSA